ncbi:IMPACT family protein [Aeromicrobium sp. UC242_57]|uniref:IMPACT family protein n=1 Tax=Aeromicrobium sp. UC242_57 TaxID=3374624 RepID=UPI0037B30711
MRRVESEAEARELIDAVRREHHDARHHCTAFVIGHDAMLQRSNDDGEPSGTAGAPMLEVLTRREISDVVAVVSRWFGGTLLGAGGLVRAYGDAVAAALDVAGVQERGLRHVMSVVAMPADAGPLDNRLRALGRGDRRRLRLAGHLHRQRHRSCAVRASGRRSDGWARCSHCARDHLARPRDVTGSTVRTRSAWLTAPWP